MKRTIYEINEKIKKGKAFVLTANEAKSLIQEKGTKGFLNEVDVVTCAAFEMNANAIAYLNFGQTDPLIYFSSASINNVPAYVAGPSDLCLSCVAPSTENYKYGGAHVIEDLTSGKNIRLKSIGHPLEEYTNKEFDTWFNLSDLNHARILLNQGINQNNIIACNSGDKDINSHMGTLIGKLENSTFNSSSYLNPLINDPFCETIGIGSKIWVAGAEGIIVGEGSNHNPEQKRNDYDIPVGPAATLAVVADLSDMDSKWVRGGFIKSFGPVLYIGIGVAIPVLNESIAEKLSIGDENIHTTIVDFSIPRRAKPIFGQCTYEELRTSTVIINRKPTLSAPLSSMAYAQEICGLLKENIMNGKFFLTEPTTKINLNKKLKKMNPRLIEKI